MQPNPFAPPQAASLEVTIRRQRKPLGIWVTQAFLLLMGWFVAGDLAKSVLQRIGPHAVVWPGQSVWIGIEALILAWLAAAMIGAGFRQAFARWMGLAFVLAVCGLLTYFSLFVDPLAHPLQAAFDDGIGALSLVIGLAIGWWFAFSTKAKAWFCVGPASQGSDGIA